MKHHLRAIIAATLLACLPSVVQAQTMTVTATIDKAPSVCTLTVSSATVSFGTLGRPGSGSGGASIDPTASSVAVSVSGGVSIVSGTPSWGEGSFKAENAPDTQTITFTIPTISSLALSGDATKTIGATLSTASSATESGTYTTGIPAIPTSELGEGETAERFFRVGASLTGIANTTDEGTYSRTTSAFSTNVNGSCA